MFGVAVLTGIVQVGCDNRDDPRSHAVASTTTETANAMRVAEAFSAEESGRGRGGGPPADALSQVANTRCNRIAACDGIGPSSLYPSRESCIRRERERAESWWGAQCTALDDERVTSCLTDLANDYCPATLDRPFIPGAGDCAATNVCRTR